MSDQEDELGTTSNKNIFSEVKATLASWVLALIPVESLVHNEVQAKIWHNSETNELQYILYGPFDSIVVAHEKIKQRLEKQLEAAARDSTCIEERAPAPEKCVSNEAPPSNESSKKKCQQRAGAFQLKRRTKRRTAGLRYKALKEKILQSSREAEEEDVDRVFGDKSDDESTGKHGNKKDYESQAPFKYFCEICSFKTKRISHLNKHTAIHKKVTTLYKCCHCSFTTVRLGHLRRHEMSHSSTVHKCDQCNYQTDEIKLLRRHMRQKHAIPEEEVQQKDHSKVWDCDQCNYKTSKQHLFERHLRIHGSKSHQCDKCCYRTWRKEHFIRHVNNVHKNKRPYLCHLCGKAFKRGDALRQHHLTHDELDSQNGIHFTCNICSKTFRSQSHLYEHRAVHSNIRAFLCEICGASFKTRSVQRKHVLTIHKNPRSHECENCSKRFNTLYALKRHAKVHVPEASPLLNSAAAPDLLQPSLMSDYDMEAKKYAMVTLAADPPVPADIQMDPLDAGTLTFQETAISTSDTINTIPQALLQVSEATTALLYLTNAMI